MTLSPVLIQAQTIQFSEVNDDGNRIYYCKMTRPNTVYDGRVFVTKGDEPYEGTITIPSHVHGEEVYGIWESAFYGATDLEGVNLPNTIKWIGKSAFMNSSLKFINFAQDSDYKITIGEKSFVNCKQLTYFAFPKNIEYWYLGILEGCDNLKTVVFPETFPKWGYSNAAKGCPLWGESPVSKVRICAEAMQYADLARAFIKDGENVYFPESVRVLEIYSLKSNYDTPDNNEWLYLPESASMQLSEYAPFTSSSTWKYSNIPHVRLIGAKVSPYHHFYRKEEYDGKNCLEIIAHELGSVWANSIKALKIPFAGSGTAENHGVFKSLFYNGLIPSSLESVELADGATKLITNAFKDCMTIKELILPSTMQGLGENALYGCSGMEDIYVLSIYPPGAYENTFDGMRLFQCKLHVPYGSKQYYENADGWKRFYHIVEDAPIDNSHKVRVTVEDTNLKLTVDAIENADSYVLKLRDTMSDEETYNSSQTLSRNGEQIVFHVGNLEPFTEYEYYVDVYNIQNEKIFSARGLFTTGNIIAAIDEIKLKSESDAELDEYYTTSGTRVKSSALKRGFYIHRQANKVEKTVIH